jgi:hypothetical protein
LTPNRIRRLKMDMLKYEKQKKYDSLRKLYWIQRLKFANEEYNGDSLSTEFDEKEFICLVSSLSTLKVLDISNIMFYQSYMNILSDVDEQKYLGSIEKITSVLATRKINYTSLFVTSFDIL